MTVPWRSRLDQASLLLMYLLFAALTWRRSGDPLVDWGRELYTAYSVSQGLGIPDDVLALFGPVSPLVNGGIFDLVSDDTSVLLVLNLAILAAALIVLYDLSRWLFSRAAAFYATLLFMVFSGFPLLTPIAIFNFLTPYSHSASHGLLLGLILLATTFRAARSESSAWWFLSGTAAALAIGTKPEVGIAAAATLGAALLGILPSRSSGYWKHCASAAIAFMATLGFVALAVLRSSQSQPMVLLEPYLNVVEVARLKLAFYGLSSGLSLDIQYLLTGLLIACLLSAAILAPRLLSGRLAERITESARRHRPLSTGGFALGLFVLFCIVWQFSWLGFAFALPWFSFAALVISAMASIRPGLLDKLGLERQRAYEIALLALYSCLLLLKHGTLSRFFHYGFFLSAPALALTVGLLVHELPSLAVKYGSPSLRAGMVGPVIALFLFTASVGQSAAFYASRTVPVMSGSSKLYIPDQEHDSRTPVIQRLFSTLAKDERFREGAVVLPEGSMLHHWLRAPSAVPLASLMPLEVQVLGPNFVLDRIRAGNPELVVVAEPNLLLWDELGRSGPHPYYMVREWLEANYCAFDKFGNGQTDIFRLEVVILQRCP